MCGIVAATMRDNIVPILLSGLQRLEYRGYDSAGVVAVGDKVSCIKRQGKVASLVAAVDINEVQGKSGMAHTRWATHGAPSEKNAHPHLINSRISLVHNGVIENATELKSELTFDGYELLSDTDSEVIAACIYEAVMTGLSLEDAVYKVIPKLRGSYALAAMDVTKPDEIIAVRCGSPLIIGIAELGYCLASDTQAFPDTVEEVLYLAEGDVAQLSTEGLVIWDQQHKNVVRKAHVVANKVEIADKGKFRHFMLKEIFEQPAAVEATLAGKIQNDIIDEDIYGRNAREVFARTQHIQIVACGTGYNAGLVAKYWFEEIAGIGCSVEIASEFRYRKRVIPDNTLFLTLSQSGETADTLAALRSTEEEKESYVATMTICNCAMSSLVRESELIYLTNVGPEIGVASTKNFIAQLTALLLLVQIFAQKNKVSKKIIDSNISNLMELSTIVSQVLTLDKKIYDLSAELSNHDNALYIGRGPLFPIALEGALKLKEISYIHAEAYPGGELKHGPLALVDSNMVVIAIAPKNDLWNKMKINLEEIHARGGKLIILTSIDNKITPPKGGHVISLPVVSDVLAPAVYSIPLQLLSYYVALGRGTDVDNPRNLAKSVTVE